MQNMTKQCHEKKRMFKYSQEIRVRRMRTDKEDEKITSKNNSNVGESLRDAVTTQNHLNENREGKCWTIKLS